MTIGARIRQLRNHHELSQEKFGEYCGGVTKGMVSQWESDSSIPPNDRLLELRKHVDFSFDWLIQGIGINHYEKTPEAMVYAAMQKMTNQEKYQMVKIGNSLAEPDTDGGNGGSGDNPNLPTAAAQ